VLAPQLQRGEEVKFVDRSDKRVGMRNPVGVDVGNAKFSATAVKVFTVVGP
jgi:hypothetical protein